jgi:hypothetical protein
MKLLVISYKWPSKCSLEQKQSGMVYEGKCIFHFGACSDTLDQRYHNANISFMLSVMPKVKIYQQHTSVKP